MSEAPASLPELASVDALDLVLDPLPLEPDSVVDGAPTTAIRELLRLGSAEIGVWEMTVGTARDVEVDELFVVVAGRATVAATRPDGSTASIALEPGTICRLAAGTRTEWTVVERLRKVYATGTPENRP